MDDPSLPPGPVPPARAGLSAWSWPCSWRGSSGPPGPCCADRGPRERTPAGPPRTRDVYADSPYQNVRPGGRVCRRRGVRPAATARSPRPTACTRWADRWRRSAAARTGPRTAPRRVSRSRRRGCSTRSSAATGGSSTRRRGATRTGASSPRSRRKSATLWARGRAASPT